MMNKIVSLPRLKKILSKKGHKQKIVLSCGTFDLFHYGHFKALMRASTLDGILVVKVNGNRFVKKTKGNDRPYLDESNRAVIISSLEFVDFVFISNKHSEDKAILQSIKPDIFIRAILNEETDDDRLNREKEILKKIPNSKIVWLEQTPEISTTKISSALIKANGSLLNQQKNLTMKSTALANK